MIRTLLLRGFRQHATLLCLLFFGLVLVELGVVTVATLINVGPGLRHFLATFVPPAQLEVIFGQFGLASFGGTVSFGFQHPLTLISGIAMATAVATVPAQERESGFLDLILARPVRRSSYLAATALLLALACLLAPAAILAGGALGLALVEIPEPVEWTAFIPSACSLALLLLAVGSYALLIATSAGRRGTAVAQVVGLTLLFYAVDFIGEFWNTLEYARLLSPFRYLDPAGAAKEGIPRANILVLGGITLASTVGAFLNFRRQDL